MVGAKNESRLQVVFFQEELHREIRWRYGGWVFRRGNRFLGILFSSWMEKVEFGIGVRRCLGLQHYTYI